jgi:hypothetical protein
MPSFDVKIPVTMTVRVEAPDEAKARWILQHVFDSRHANDPSAGLRIPVGYGCTAQIMTTTFNVYDRSDIEVEEV